MLDERLSLAYRLYGHCKLAADIGTDHAYLPSELLINRKCERMILTDISPSALDNARREIIRRNLQPRVQLRCGDGILPLYERCEMISVLGMGGQTISRILSEGRDHLYGASLLLSAHTDLDLVRSTLCSIDYTIDREEPCLSGGRFYLLIRAYPGKDILTPQQIRIGKKLFGSSSPVLKDYIRRRSEVLLSKYNGLLRASSPDIELKKTVEEDIAFYRHYLEVGNEDI